MTTISFSALRFLAPKSTNFNPIIRIAIFLGVALVIAGLIAWPFIAAERIRNRRIAEALYRLGDAYRDGSERLKAEDAAR